MRFALTVRVPTISVHPGRKHSHRVLPSVDLSPCPHLRNLHITHHSHVPISLPIWPHVTKSLLRPLRNRRLPARPLRLQISLMVKLYIHNIRHHDQIYDAFLEHTDNLAEALKLAAKAGGVEQFVVHILVDNVLEFSKATVDPVDMDVVKKRVQGECFKTCGVVQGRGTLEAVVEGVS